MAEQHDEGNGGNALGVKKEDDSAAQENIGFLLKQISDALHTRMNTELEAYDLTFSQIRVLRCLDIAGGECTQKQIETELKVSHPTVVGLVARLEKNGFVTTRPGDAGQKSKVVSATEKARRQREEVEKNRKITESIMLSGLSTGEVEELKRLLTIVSVNIKAEYPEREER